jgi:hypothetical protein
MTVLVATVVMITALAATAVAGCANGAQPATDGDGVAPLDGSAMPDRSAVSSGDGTNGDDRTASDQGDGDPDGRVAADAPTDGAGTVGRSTGGAPPASSDDERNRAHAIASEVLDRYGMVLTELAAEPAIDLGRFATRWSTVADPSSAFSRDMLHTLTSRVRDDQMVIRPGPNGRSYLHRPVRVTTVAADEIAFTWCGYSPGIGVHVVTGEVLDDAIGHASGTGRLVRSDERWLLDTLDQDQLTALPAGSSDPCATGGDR